MTNHRGTSRSLSSCYILNWFPFVLEEGQVTLVAWNLRSSLAAGCFPLHACSRTSAPAGLPQQTREGHHSAGAAMFLTPKVCTAN